MDTAVALATNPWVVGGVVAGSSLFVLLSPFILGSSGGHEKDPKYAEWIMSICGGSKFANSLLSIGYAKYAFRTFFQRVGRVVRGVPQARLGSAAPDAPLLDLRGAPTSLQAVLREAPAGMPVVLNFGSYT
jgi:hypothetical protein